MGTEIEHRFLIANESWRDEVISSARIDQSYFRKDVVIYVLGEDDGSATLRINTGAEYAYKISYEDANELDVILRSGNYVARVRRYGDEYFVTVKGKKDGISAPEFNISIPEEDYRLLKEDCSKPISKIRHLVKHNMDVWEVDEFSGDCEGLVIAELEVKHVGVEFEYPEWLGLNISLDHRYANSNLASNPRRS